MKRGPGRWRAPVAGVVSGLLFALAFPPFDLVVLLPLALVPWLVALLREESPARALVSGALFGLAYWCASIPWIVYVVTHYGGQSGPMGVVSLAILSLILAEWPAAVAWATVAWAPAGSLGRLAVFPLLWVASEHARSFVYKGFPWNLTGHALFRHPLWLQTASVWGVYGVGALVVAVSALLAAGIATRRPRLLALAAVLVLAAGAFGAARLGAPAPRGPELTVALLQPNVTEEMRATPQGAAEAYGILLAQAREAAARRPALIVFPESALPLYWDHSPTLRGDFAEIAREGPAILFGDVEEDTDGRYYNVARLLTRDGLAGAAYRKVHLVPFGEYVPLPKLFFFVRQISNDIGEFSAAAEPAVIRSGPLALGLGICYEIIYPELSRRETSSGANLLGTISNDSWYGRAGAQEQHFAGAALRTVENGRSLIRAAITGISGIADARGRILTESRANERTILYGAVRLLDGRTIWTRWGYWIPRLADLAGAAVLVFALVRLVRRRRAGSGERTAESLLHDRTR